MLSKLFTFQMTKNLPFVHPSETELLDKICKLGGLYRMFENFIEKYSVNLIPVNRILKTGIYPLYYSVSTTKIFVVDTECGKNCFVFLMYTNFWIFLYYFEFSYCWKE